MNKFKEYKIDINEKNIKLVEVYLEKIKEFINNNSLEWDLYYDIEERVFEKLSSSDKLNQLKIKQILNEIWEPEDIFELEEWKQNSDFFVFIRNLKNSWTKVVLKIFETGINLWNIIVFIKTLLKWTFNFLKKLIIKLYKFSIETIKLIYNSWSKIINFLLKIAKKIFNIFWNIIWFIILLFSIILLFVVPILYSWIELWTINYSNIVPNEILIWYSFLILAIAVLWIYFILKKHFLIHFIVFWVSMIAFLSFWFLWATKIFNNYLYEGEINKTYELESNTEILRYNNYDSNLYWNLYLKSGLSDDIDIELKKSDNKNFKINVITKIYSKDENSFNEVTEKLNDFELKESEWNIILWVLNWEVFNEKTNFTPIVRKIEINIPEDKILKMWHYNRYYYSNFIWNCDSKIFWIINGEITCLEKIKK